MSAGWLVPDADESLAVRGYRMAGVFDIELHDGEAANQDESDDDVIENREVEFVSGLPDIFKPSHLRL